ncbi:MAG: IS1634 family transposase [Limisphaerales bacterium]
MRKPSLFLKCHERFKNGKQHRYWSLAENQRCAGGRMVQRQVLYLGEINDAQRAAWIKQIEVFDTQAQTYTTAALFPEDRLVPAEVARAIQIRLNEFEVERPRQWGACWLALWLWELLGLDKFWAQRLLPSREGTHWDLILAALTAYRLIEPGSEWRLHRHWYGTTALGDLLGPDFSLGGKDNLYRCLDQLLEHKRELFSHLRQRWADLFAAKFDVLLYDLTSTYFESDPPWDEQDIRRFGYSRDKRSDCVQVVLAVVLTPEGYPIGYEVLPGNTADNTTLSDIRKKVEEQYGQVDRIWLMDRGIPTEESLAAMRASQPPVRYLVGTPKGRLTRLEKKLTDLPWTQARDQVQVKLLAEAGEVYVLVQSQARVNKERSMRRRRLKRLWARLKELRAMKDLSRDDLLKKLGVAQSHAGRVASLVEVKEPAEGQPVNPQTFSFTLRKKKLRVQRRREGRYLLRSNLSADNAAKLWEMYLLLAEIEAAFKSLKSDLRVRPIHHQLEERIQAHIFVAFLALCLNATLRGKLRPLAPGLTPRAVLDKLACIQMLDVYFPTTDGRKLRFRRHTKPEKDQALLLARLKLQLPPQPPPEITTDHKVTMK